MLNPLMNFQNLQAMTAASGYPNASYYAPQARPSGPYPVGMPSPYAAVKNAYRGRLGAGMQPMMAGRRPRGMPKVRPFSNPLNHRFPPQMPQFPQMPQMPQIPIWLSARM